MNELHRTPLERRLSSCSFQCEVIPFFYSCSCLTFGLFCWCCCFSSNFLCPAPFCILSLFAEGLNPCWKVMLWELPRHFPPWPWTWPSVLPIKKIKKKPPFLVSQTLGDVQTSLLHLWPLGTPWACPASTGRRHPFCMFLLTRSPFVYPEAYSVPVDILASWQTIGNYLFVQFMFYFKTFACFCLPLHISLLINLVEDEKAELELTLAVLSLAHVKNKVRKELRAI